jgi:hypothetical protein
MRTCQICGNTERELVEFAYCDKQFPRMDLFACVKCGHRYIDADELNQAWFDNYYLTQYRTDDLPYSNARLNSLADCIAGHKPIMGLDIGGTDGELQSRLIARGIECDTLGVGGEVNRLYDAVVVSHVLEHVYDIASIFLIINQALRTGGLLFIETPLHDDCYVPSYDYDYHWQHINKFRMSDLEQFLYRFKYRVYYPPVRLDDYREYKTVRIVGRK